MLDNATAFLIVTVGVLVLACAYRVCRDGIPYRK